MNDHLNLLSELKSESTELERQYILAQIDQRIQSGFSDKDAIKTSHYLASILPEILERLASITNCMPMSYDELEDWRNHLNHLAEMFREAHRLEHDGETALSDQAIKVALSALGENFWDLWCQYGTEHE